MSDALREAIRRTLAELEPDVLHDGEVRSIKLTSEVEDMRMVNLPLSPFDPEQEGDLVEDVRVTLSYVIAYPLASATCEAHTTVARFTRGAGCDLSWREDLEAVIDVVSRTAAALRHEHATLPSTRSALGLLIDSDAATLNDTTKESES